MIFIFNFNFLNSFQCLPKSIAWTFLGTLLGTGGTRTLTGLGVYLVLQYLYSIVRHTIYTSYNCVLCTPYSVLRRLLNSPVASMF
jgi:hypothetical protein